MDIDEKVIEEAINRILIITEQRNKTMRQLKQALLENNEDLIKLYAKELCGVSSYECN